MPPCRRRSPGSIAARHRKLSAAICASMDFRPWPCAVAPVLTTIRPDGPIRSGHAFERTAAGCLDVVAQSDAEIVGPPARAAAFALCEFDPSRPARARGAGIRDNRRCHRPCGCRRAAALPSRRACWRRGMRLRRRISSRADAEPCGDRGRAGAPSRMCPAADRRRASGRPACRLVRHSDAVT